MQGSLKITYVGHATVLIELDGIRLLTDPILRNKILHLRRSNSVVEDAWYQGIDAVLISHQHWDHLDFPSLKMLDEATQLFVPRGTGAMFERRGFRHIREMTAGDSVRIQSVNIEATEADHDGARFRFGPPADCLGYVLHGSYTVYFAGDTGAFAGFARIGAALGPFDLAALPIGAYMRMVT